MIDYIPKGLRSVRTEKFVVKCPTCRDSLRPGLLWLGGGDYLECPSCTKGAMPMNEYVVRPMERSISIPKRIG